MESAPHPVKLVKVFEIERQPGSASPRPCGRTNSAPHKLLPVAPDSKFTCFRRL